MATNLIINIVAGFCGQLIDGCLGMAYGVSSNSFLLSLGVSPASASASVHTAEVFTTGVSGLSHWKFGNIDKDLLRRLIIPGVIGGVLGAYTLAKASSDAIRPFVSLYLFLIGFRIVGRAVKKDKAVSSIPSVLNVTLLGFIGGVFDAFGGGGWGPIVTTTLMSRGTCPRKTIGSVNFSEFFVMFAEMLTFTTTIGIVNWRVIVGLAIGGVLAAPTGAYLTNKIPAKPMMFMVGALIMALSLRTMYLSRFI